MNYNKFITLFLRLNVLKVVDIFVFKNQRESSERLL